MTLRMISAALALLLAAACPGAAQEAPHATSLPPSALSSLPRTAGTDAFTGREAVLIGGRRIPGFAGQTVRDPGANAQLNLVGAPYGPFNAGCVLCVFTSQSDISDNRAGISGLDYHQGASAVSGADLVGFYEAPSTLEARMVLDVDHYDRGAVILRRPMSAAQMAQLHKNMYIITNSLDPHAKLRPLPMYDDNAIRLVNLMSGIISGWSADGRRIEVAAWRVPSASDMSAGQVPDKANLDRYWSQYGKPVVFVGAGTKMFARNTWMYYDGAKTKGRATSLIRAMETEEVDLRYTASRAHEVEMRGMTISMDPLGGYGPHGLTSDSYHLLLSGYSPNMLMFNDGRDTNVIKAHSFYVHGNEGVDAGHPAREMFEHSAYADGASNMRLAGYLTRTGAEPGASSAALHFGLRIDGTQGEPLTGGSWGEIVWNKDAANNGGFSLCGGSGRCGATQRWDGGISLAELVGFLSLPPDGGIRFMDKGRRVTASIHADPAGDVAIEAPAGGGGLRTTAYTMATLPPGKTVGLQLYCTDCRSIHGGGHAGVPVWWNGSAWADALGDRVR